MRGLALASSVAAGLSLGLAGPLLAAQPPVAGTADHASPKESNVSATKPAKKCLSDLRTFDGQMGKSGYWLGGSGDGYGFPIGASGYGYGSSGRHGGLMGDQSVGGHQANATDYQNAQQQVAAATPVGAAFAPAATTPLGKAFTDTNALKDPISAAVQSVASTKQSTAYSNYQSAQRSAEQAYQKLAKLTPRDANAQLQLGQAAQSAQDTPVAIAAYEKFLKLAPHDPLSAQVKQQLKTLRAQTAAVTQSSTSG